LRDESVAGELAGYQEDAAEETVDCERVEERRGWVMGGTARAGGRRTCGEVEGEERGWSEGRIGGGEAGDTVEIDEAEEDGIDRVRSVDG
jgi:hypothetical protein